jgi:homoserine O-acetyltransferase
VERFDANSYLYITKAMDYFDVSRGRPLAEVFRERIGSLPVRVMVIAFRSDWLYPAYQSQEIAKACKLAGVDASYCEIASTYGHDAFLVETEKETHLVRYFLENGRAEAAGSAYGI